MKIAKKILKKLILETIKEIFVPGKEEDKFVDPKTGKVIATAPKVTKLPKLKNPFGEGPENREKFLSTFKPVITFSYNMPDFDKKPIHDLSSKEPQVALTIILSSINYRRNTNRNSNNITSEYVNADFGSSFSPEEIKNIADAIKQTGNLVNGDKVEQVYRNLGGEITKYIPSVISKNKERIKTVSMKSPGVFEEKMKNKKMKVKYSCN